MHVACIIAVWNASKWSQPAKTTASSSTASNTNAIHVTWVLPPKQVQHVHQTPQPELIKKQITHDQAIIAINQPKAVTAITQHHREKSKQQVNDAVAVPTPKAIDLTVHSNQEQVQPVKETARLNADQPQKPPTTNMAESVATKPSQAETLPTKPSPIKAIHRRVNYPNRARALGVEGKVTAQFDVSEHGMVRNISILSETPKGVFADAVLQDMARWRYESAHEATQQKVTILFKLNGQVVVENNSPL